MIKQAVIVAGLVCLVLLLAACATDAPSGPQQDHLGRYAAQAVIAKGQAIDPAARRSALREPALRFPARIGLARLETGALSPVPQGEADAWLAMIQTLGPGWGEFVPISPAEVAARAPANEAASGCAEGTDGAAASCDPIDIATTVRDIRLSALRHHLDAVLIYEVFDGGQQASIPSAITRLALLDRLSALSAPARTDRQAQGVLVDVRNGAVYGFAASDAEAGPLLVRDEATTAVADLAEETGVMLRDLRIELAEARAMRAEVED